MVHGPDQGVGGGAGFVTGRLFTAAERVGWSSGWRPSFERGESEFQRVALPYERGGGAFQRVASPYEWVGSAPEQGGAPFEQVAAPSERGGWSPCWNAASTLSMVCVGWSTVDAG